MAFMGLVLMMFCAICTFLLVWGVEPHSFVIVMILVSAIGAYACFSEVDRRA